MCKNEKLGLYTTAVGTELVTLFRLQHDLVNYQLLIPFRMQPAYCPTPYFFKKYPVRVTSVEVEKGAKKTKKVEAGRLYTDGKKVVSVKYISPAMCREVTFNQDIPFHLWSMHTSLEEFRAKYCWELDLGSIVLMD